MVAGGRELIDTLWNVNYLDKVKEMALVMELIDTLWNVNVKIIRWQSGQLEELIDTLWNVNLTIVPSFGDSAGINRYIMECK